MKFLFYLLKKSTKQFNKKRLEKAQKLIKQAEYINFQIGDKTESENLYREATTLLNPSEKDEFPLFFEASKNYILLVIENGNRVNAIRLLDELKKQTKIYLNNELDLYSDLTISYLRYKCRSELDTVEKEELKNKIIKLIGKQRSVCNKLSDKKEIESADKKDVVLLCEALLVIGDVENEYMTEALQWCNNFLPEDYLLQTRIRNNIAGKKNDIDFTLSEFLEILKIRESKFDRNNYYTATTSYNVAIQYMIKKDYKSALLYMSKALNIYKHYGKNNKEQISRTLHMIARCYSLSYNYPLADEYFKKALSVLSKVKFKTLRKVYIFSDWGMSYQKRQDYKNAKKCLKNALMLVEQFDSILSSKIEILLDLANLIQEEDSLSLEALVYVKRVVREIKYNQNISEKDLANFYEEIAKIYRTAKKFEETIFFYYKASEIYQKNLTEDEYIKNCITCYEKLSVLYKNYKNAKKSDYYKEQVEALKNKLQNPEKTDNA